MAFTIRNERLISMDGGIINTVVDIDADTLADLPLPNSLAGHVLHQGSAALIINEGRLAVLSGDGKWRDMNGTVVKEA